jgi:arginine decarboxylase
MKIHIGAGTGSGTTKLSAFDAALNAAGIANYNLLLLSSVIPPKSEIVIHDNKIMEDMPGDWGDRLYLVMAEQRTDVVGEEVWAGIGWVQDEVTGRGLFVEHEGHSEQDVRNDIAASLKMLMKTRGIDFGEIHMKVTGATCAGEPISAMVVAAYQSSDWRNKPTLFDKA